MDERYILTGDRDFDAVIFGIRELDMRYASDLESRQAQIHELVTSISHTKQDSTAVLEALKSLRSKQSNAVSVFERICICREYLSIYPSALEFSKAVFFGSADSLSEAAKNKVAFIENSHTNEALLRFTSRMASPITVPLESFDELCESVYSGEAEFGILPIESTDNGKLLYFYSLINKYELKISAVCSVDTSDLGSTTFALVRKSIEYPQLRFGKPDMLELFVTPRENDSFSDILTAAELCSLRLYRVDSLPLSYRSESFITCPVFRAEKAEIDVFLLYMALDFPQYTPIGIYSYLK